MHNKKNSTYLDGLVASIETMDDQQLDRLQAAVDQRRSTLKNKQSTVIERRA